MLHCDPDNVVLRINLICVSIFLNVNIYCGPSLEPSRQDRSNEGPAYLPLVRNMENPLKLSLLSFLSIV